jgi:predicted nucleotide-binding protein
MTADDVRQLLTGAGEKITSDSRLPNNTGDQLRTAGGSIVNVFDTGKVQIQGKNRERIEALISTSPGEAVTDRPAQKRSVFVVYGHDQASRDQLEAMLRRWRVEPLILDQLPTEGQTIIEKLERAIDECDFGVVLATPDDEGHRAGREDERTFRARQNVVLELGMLLARLGRKRVAILIKDQAAMERPSDIQGPDLHPVQGRGQGSGSLARESNGCRRLRHRHLSPVTSVRPTALTLSCAAKTHVPKPSGRDGCDGRAAISGARKKAGGLPPSELRLQEGLQPRTDAGPQQLQR